MVDNERTSHHTFCPHHSDIILTPVCFLLNISCGYVSLPLYSILPTSFSPSLSVLLLPSLISLLSVTFPFQFLVHVLLSPPPPWYFTLISSSSLLAEYSTGLGHQTCTQRFLGDTATMFVCAPLIQLESNWKQHGDMQGCGGPTFIYNWRTCP